MRISKADCPEMIKETNPAQDGFYMPGEFERHQGCIMIWPERPGSWRNGAREAEAAFSAVICAIAESETVYVAAGKKGIGHAKAFAQSLKEEENLYPVIVFEMETDDSWARDVAPTFLVKNVNKNSIALTADNQMSVQADCVKNKKVYIQDLCSGTNIGCEKDSTGMEIHTGKNLCIRGVNWNFNAWGGTVDGLYASYEKDNAFAWNFCKKFGFTCYDARPFVLEGGSIHSDGEGTLLVTESCLLSEGRNPSLTKEQIEEKLKSYLSAEKVLWLPRGIYQDETNEHVDNVCAFLRPGEVVLAWTDDKNDPQYALSKASFDYLSSEYDAKGRKLIIHKLPIPDTPVCITKEELEGYEFEEGEDKREVGERLAASYVNFYFSNNAVVMPAFGGENEKSDRLAQQIMAELCPERKIIPVYARDILTGGGNIHCITQQIPAYIVSSSDK